MRALPLAALLALLPAAALAQGSVAPVRLPTVTGPLNHTGSIYSIGNGAIRNTTQPINSFIDMIAPNDQFHDNVQTIENQSFDAATGRCGNAAIRFRAINGYEKGAVGYSRLGSDTRCSTGFFTNSLYMEGGNLGPDGNPDDTDLLWVMTHVPGSTNFPNTSYRIFWAEAATGKIRMTNSKYLTTAEFDTENHITTFYGAANGNHIQLAAGPAGSPSRIAVFGNDTNVGLNVVTKGTGQLLVNGAPVAVSNTANVFNQLQTFGNGIRLTGGGVSSSQYTFNTTNDEMIASDGAGGIFLRSGTGGTDFYAFLRPNGDFETQRNIAATSYSASGTAGVTCTAAPTANFRTVNGIVTAC